MPKIKLARSIRIMKMKGYLVFAKAQLLEGFDFH